jgi:hypothetical protein
MIHELKLWPEFFEPVKNESKKFELRKADRDYKVGDVLILREWSPETEEYTGRILKREVTYMISGPKLGLEEGYCILSLGLVNNSNLGTVDYLENTDVIRPLSSAYHEYDAQDSNKL